MLTMMLANLRYRPTRDIDMLRDGPEDRDQILEDIVAICSIDGQSDGLVFDASRAVLEEIREHDRYHGTRVRLPVTLGIARVTLQIDLGFGDAVQPPPKAVTIGPLLGNGAPQVLAYPVEVVLAEKLGAVVSIGMVTGRMKDIFAISRAYYFDRGALIESIEATFHRRSTLCRRPCAKRTP